MPRRLCEKWGVGARHAISANPPSVPTSAKATGKWGTPQRVANPPERRRSGATPQRVANPPERIRARINRTFIMWEMDARGISLAMSFLLPCPSASATATLTLPIAQAPLHAPEEKPEPAHPPHGEGSGELPTFSGISASGAMANVNATVTTTSSEPITTADSHHAHYFFAKPVQQKITVITPRSRRFLPPTRRSC
jgi:hypothetical protein